MSKRASFVLNFKNGKAIEKSFAIQAYLSFCELYHLDPFETHEAILYRNLLRFTVYRLDFLDGTAGTAKTDITAIEKYLAAYGIHSNAKKWKPLEKFLLAINESHPKKNQTKRAFRPSELNLIFEKLLPTSINTILLRCLISFAVSGALRASEYSAPSKNPPTNRMMNMVTKGRIYKFIDNEARPSMIYMFFRSKMNHSWKPEFAVTPCICDVPLPCAFHELQRLEKLIKKAHSKTYLFVWSDGSFITYNDALNCFKKASALVGADPDSIGTLRS